MVVGFDYIAWENISSLMRFVSWSMCVVYLASGSLVEVRGWNVDSMLAFCPKLHRCINVIWYLVFMTKEFYYRRVLNYLEFWGNSWWRGPLCFSTRCLHISWLRRILNDELNSNFYFNSIFMWQIIYLLFLCSCYNYS